MSQEKPTPQDKLAEAPKLAPKPVAPIVERCPYCQAQVGEKTVALALDEVDPKIYSPRAYAKTDTTLARVCGNCGGMFVEQGRLKK